MTRATRAVYATALGAFVLAGCATRTGIPAYLVNQGDAILNVELVMARTSIPSHTGQQLVCGFDPRHVPIRSGPASEARDAQFRGWPAVELSNYDDEACSAGMELPPGGALLLFWNGTCSDYESNRDVSKDQPTLARLSITGGGRSIQLTGFETARAFKASSRRRDCRLLVK
jgi:hypothetical protein